MKDILKVLLGPRDEENTLNSNSPIIGPPVTQGQLSDGIQNKLCNSSASCGKTRRWSEDVDVVELE